MQIWTIRKTDQRRDKRKCIYYSGGLCKNGKLRFYNHSCPGSSHCDYYDTNKNHLTLYYHKDF